MKTMILLVVAIPGLFRAGIVNDGKYIETMKKNIAVVYTSKSSDELQKAINAFGRIADVEKTKWEPHYYSAFAWIMMANQEKAAEKKDSYLDQALVSVKKAQVLAPAEPEIVALEGFVHMIRVSVDPGARGPQYAGLAMQTFGKAVSMDPENPRALALLAQMQYGTAQFFGSSTAEACGTLQKALEQFETYTSANPLAPQWGRPMAEAMKAQCK